MLEAGKVYKFKKTNNLRDAVVYFNVVIKKDECYCETGAKISAKTNMFRMQPIETGEKFFSSMHLIYGWAVEMWIGEKLDKKFICFIPNEKIKYWEKDNEILDADQHLGEIWNAYSERWSLL